MSFRRNFGRKQIGDKNYLTPQMETLSRVIELPTVDKSIKIVTSKNYTATEEDLILIKNVDECILLLTDDTSEYVTIKSLTNVTIKPINSKIDEYYDELSISKGACVELHRIDNGWYILSSDGVKLD